EPRSPVTEFEKAALEGADVGDARNRGDPSCIVVGGEGDSGLVVFRVGDPQLRVRRVAVCETVDTTKQVISRAAQRDSAEDSDGAGRRKRERAQRRRLQRGERDLQ